MSYLEISETRSQKFDEVEKLALDVLIKALKDGGEIGDEVTIAVKTLNMVAKNRQTLTAREAIRWSMVQTLDDPIQLKKYIGFSEPEIKKALTL